MASPAHATLVAAQPCIQAVHKKKETALHWTCYKRVVMAALRLLSCQGARDALSCINSHGRTPLLLPCWRGLGEVAMAMLELDAAACTIQAVDKKKDTALHWACNKGLAQNAQVRRRTRCELSCINSDGGGQNHRPSGESLQCTEMCKSGAL